MPIHRYTRTESRLAEEPSHREWPARTIDHPPLWCSVDLRDGNQALPNPMDLARKGAIFDLLVQMGFKEIEVGYPSASEAEFAFVRELVTHDRIPDDVTISVFTPAKIDLIDRTFEAIEGVERAVVHLCLATSCLWREVVFALTADELHQLTVESAEHVVRRADAMPGSQLRFEYSPETFNVTEPEFALVVSDAVATTWDASPDRPMTLNLPTTVETDSPNVFADQVEWMHRNLARRESIILSVHPHNDRGTAVASAELALMAGADRVEGTLFGNGERTGNVCLATLGLNLFSRGVDPQLDFSDIDDVRRTVEQCNQLPVHPRHPYVGDLVYTAFSGTHQDAIAKGFVALDERARQAGLAPAELTWEVPYLPLDPRDVGRTYESVVRVNSQSGKGGVAHVLRSHHQIDLPRDFRVELGRIVQRITDESGVELNSRQLWEVFTAEYLQPSGSLLLKEFAVESSGIESSGIESGSVRLEALVAWHDGRERRLVGVGESPGAAFVASLREAGQPVDLMELTDHPMTDSTGTRTAAFAVVAVDETVFRGVGLDPSPAGAALAAVLAALNRARRGASTP